jgi:hypothetical protein
MTAKLSKIDKLRNEALLLTAALKKAYHERRTQAPPPNPVFVGFCRGLSGEPPPIDKPILHPRGKPYTGSMTSTAPPISFAKLAKCYPCTRQRLQQVAAAHGREVLLNPDELAAVMLPRVFAAPAPSALVDALRDPAERIRIAAQLRQLLS